MSHGFIRIEVGRVYSNDLTPRFLEHRRVVSLEGERVQYLITHGRRFGSTGTCTVQAFWCWQRLLVEEPHSLEPGRLCEAEALADAIRRCEAGQCGTVAEVRQIGEWLKQLMGLRNGSAILSGPDRRFAPEAQGRAEADRCCG